MRASTNNAIETRHSRFNRVVSVVQLNFFVSAGH